MLHLAVHQINKNVHAMGRLPMDLCAKTEHTAATPCIESANTSERYARRGLHKIDNVHALL
jgi:hypothetical protein